MILAPVRGLAEVAPGDDLVDLLAPALAAVVWPDGTLGVKDGDVVVVTSKVVAKAEGRLVPESQREAAIDAESVAEVARVPGPAPQTRITRTHHGLVLASAGVDASNVPEGSVLLLPRDPDSSARTLRAGLSRALDRTLAVLVSDTAGRAWRIGQVDIAIGVAGLCPVSDLRGTSDHNGRVMSATVRAVADALVGAAELVAGKAAHVPVVVVRGLAAHVQDDDGPGAAALIRPIEEDLFRLGTAEAWAQGEARGRALERALDRPALLADLLAARRTIRTFGELPVPAGLIRDAVAAAVTAPAPHHSRPWLFVHLRDRQRRTRLLDRMAEQWSADLRGDGLDEAAISRRIARGDILRRAPEVVAVFMSTERAHTYPDERRSRAEREMFLAAGGAALGQFLLALSTSGLGAAWISSSIFCPDVVVSELDLPADHLAPDSLALGMVAIGWPVGSPPAARPATPVPLYTV